MSKTLNSRKVLIALFLTSGFAALLYQLVWVRLLGEVFGRTAYAISTVLACFMGGLALGSWLVGRYTRWQSKPVLWYLVVESGIGLSAIFVNYAIGHIGSVYQTFYLNLEHNQILLSVIRLGISAPLLLVPTSLMGATLPILSRIIFQQDEHIGRDFSTLYGFNTLGAALGALVAGFFLFEKVGVHFTANIAVAINLLIAGTVFLLRGKIEFSPADTSPIKEASNELATRTESDKQTWIFMVVLFVNGFIALGLEVFWVRMFAYFVGNSTYAFTLILVMHLIGIAAGSWIISRFADTVKQPARLLMYLQLGAALSLMIALFSFGGVFRSFLTAPTHSWSAYLLTSISKTAIILLPPTILMGCIFPMLNRTLLYSIKNVGPRIGKLYALNTLGAILGSLLAGFVLIQLIGVSTGIAFSAAIYAISALLIATIIKSEKARRNGLRLSTIILIGMILIGWRARGYQLATHDELQADRVLFYKEGVSATAKVYHTDVKGRGLVMAANGSMIGADNRSIMRKQALLAHLPMLVLPHPKSAFIVGLGTGVTLGEILKYPLDWVVCAEISETVIDASRQFLHVNHLNYNDPRLKWVKDDGKIWLANTNEKFDLISSDTMLRRGSSGNGRMYTEDYYRLGLEHLTEIGAFVQWVPAYLQPEVHRMIVRTFTKVFPYVTGWYVGNETLILIGTKHPVQLSIPDLHSQINEPGIHQLMTFIDFPDWQSVVSTMVFNKKVLQEYTGDGLLNTIDHPLVEFAAPRNFSATANVGLFLKAAELDFIDPASAAPDLELKGISSEELTDLATSSVNYQLVIKGIAARILIGERNGKAYLCQALANNPDDPHALHFLGLSPNEPDTYLKSKLYLDTALLLKQQNHLDLAYALLDSAVQIDPHNIIAYNKYYTWLLDAGDLESAVRITERAVKNNPGNTALSRDLDYMKSQLLKSN